MLLTEGQREHLIDIANDAFLDASVRWHWRRIEYTDTAPVWVAYRMPNLKPWSRSGDMVPESMQVFRFTGEHAAKSFTRRQIITEVLDAVLSARLANQSVKGQGDCPLESANSPGERG